MEYGYSFNEDSPRFALSSLWFLLGVIVFGFTVLIMAAIVTPGGSDGAYLDVAPQRQTQQTARPANGRTTQRAATPVITRSMN